MDLAERKQQVLKAIVECYIATGEPVGSKTLQNDLFVDVSSATIRNDMADLTAKGYLNQPHTSAGRVPSVNGYRFYVERLMKQNPLEDRIKDFILERLTLSADAPENILKKAASVLCDVTGLVAITSTPPGNDARVHKVRFVQTGRHTAMAVLITSTGMVKTRLFRCEFVINSDVLAVFDKALNARLSGMMLSEITQPFIQTIAASFGELALFMPSVLLAIMDTAQQAMLTNISMEGQANILFLPEMNIQQAGNLLKFMNNSNELESLLSLTPKGTGVFIGEETSKIELVNSAVVVTRYEISGQTAGAIALIGPQRMNYSKAIGSLEYTSQVVGNLIDELIEA